MGKNAKILFLFSLLVLAVLIKHSQGALLFYFYNFNPTQVPIPSMDEVWPLWYIPYFKSLTEHFIHWIPGTTSQGTNLDESSVSNSSSNWRGMAILIYHIKSLQELHFRNNKIRNQLWWIFCIPGRLSSQNVNFASDVSSINWILHIIIE